jgi:hypothetical protein
MVIKLFGLITLALGIQFILTGVNGAFPKLVRQLLFLWILPGFIEKSMAIAKS